MTCLRYSSSGLFLRPAFDARVVRGVMLASYRQGPLHTMLAIRCHLWQRSMRLAVTREPPAFQRPPSGNSFSTALFGPDVSRIYSYKVFSAIAVTAIVSGGVGFSLSKSYNNPSRIESLWGEKLRFGGPEDFLAALKSLQADFPASQLSLDPSVLHFHGFSSHNHHPGTPHGIVVYPKSTEDVVRIVNVSRDHRIPIVPYAGGTSLEGHTAGVSAPSSNDVMSQKRSLPSLPILLEI
ncbi:uncharacterized protein EI90DRAFT_2671547 [Cantharellus anzutake]|uniref:uncharacterized protein n=1 Tax=Cantharellus anzutake TaxID=1750568 RepID=UPI00190444CD|nr:uncharacterized protein EI90DRAFT_2671547 [Cantharellus anzutake]KAF8337615.1 hypothetical protein EI90DRAFT_2671547 [Cantharellus anzutake]